jgi:trimethylamine corrinoid protein
MRLKEAVINGQENDAEEAARAVIDAGADLLDVMERELFPAMKSVGERFETGEFFLPDLMSAADAMRVASRVLTDKIREQGKTAAILAKKAKVVIGTVSSDIHDIGKNIVALLLEVNGFDTHDLGKDVESMKFIERGSELQADIIALSALMTTTKPAQKEVVNLLTEMDLRKQHVIMVGGAPTTQEWADQIGADGWAETAEEAVRTAEKLVKKR